MPQRTFKRKSNAKGPPKSESNTEVNGTVFLASNHDDANASAHEVQIPNRVFVGGIAANVNEWDIRCKFANFGTVRAVKIIRDQCGVSKGYGFVTFNVEEEAKRVLEKAEITVKGRKLNIAPAVKKQALRLDSQSCDTSSGESRSESITNELPRRRFGNYNFSRFNERAVEHVSISSEMLPFVNESPCFIDCGAYYGASENYQAYGNSPMNCLFSYPTLVYVPQHPFQCPNTGITYPVGSTHPEVVQIVAAPASTCYINPDLK